jgi:hypothetical protein
MHDRLRSDELRELERERLRSLVKPDLPRAAELHAADYELIPPSGRRLSRDEYLGMIDRGEFTYDVFEPASEIAVRIFHDAAAVRYQARIAARWSGGSDQGLYWHTDLYELREGRWQAVWSHATRIRDAD